MVYESLVDNGVRTVFGYSGGANLPVLDQFNAENSTAIQFIMNRSEQCCGHAAEGYAKSSGRTGVVLVTSGPGLTNIITPLQDAKGDSVPLVALSGQVPTAAAGTDAFQECDAVNLTKPCTKWSYQLQSVEEIPAVISEAFAVANRGKKGPVHIDMPKDVMTELLQGESLAPAKNPPFGYLSDNAKDQISKVAELCAVAQKPIIIAGQGVIDCPELLTEFARSANIPVATTLHAMGCFDEHDPLSLHMLGMHGSAYANYAVQQADLILGIGSRFDDRTTGVVAKYAPAALAAERAGVGGIVHVDIEDSQIGRVIAPTHGICGDSKMVLEALIAEVQHQDRTDWIHQVQKLRADNPFKYKPASDDRIKTQSVIEALNNYVDKTDTSHKTFVSTGVGNHQMMSCQFFRWRKPRSIISSGSLGTMGFGLPAAIGAQVANPDATVVLIDGDGSFNMTLNDLGTVLEHQLPIKIFIMNDARQQMVHIWQALFFDGRLTATDNVNPDFCQLAQSYGFKTVHCDSQTDLPRAVEELMSIEGPALGDFRTVPDICLPMVAPGKALDDMYLFGDIDYEKLEQTKMTGLAPS